MHFTYNSEKGVPVIYIFYLSFFATIILSSLISRILLSPFSVQSAIKKQNYSAASHSDRGDRSGRSSHRGRGGRGHKGDDDIDDGTTLSFLTEMMATTMSL
ncbi:hypothetical protein RCL_jg16114.t1 [Rhizophagus clarus]|uniref:Uncharacterized protein n=1 Tax=Rhizophagus clarus TaxID=94130 RepID=A0A8H3LCX4_9GLOM|nr:hypothetical protein RCL_jg16114.t1 [Rhizophagus clarus]